MGASQGKQGQTLWNSPLNQNGYAYVRDFALALWRCPQYAAIIDLWTERWAREMGNNVLGFVRSKVPDREGDFSYWEDQDRPLSTSEKAKALLRGVALMNGIWQ